MINIKWRKKPAISKKLLDQYIAKMNKHASFTDEFSILIPTAIYEHIKSVGVNAKITVIPRITVIPYTNIGMDGMVWIRVEKSETKIQIKM